MNSNVQLIWYYLALLYYAETHRHLKATVSINRDFSHNSILYAVDKFM